jgi:hypothetical protein
MNSLGDLPHSYLQTMTGVGIQSNIPEDVDLTAGNDRLLVSHPLGTSRGPSGDAAWLTYPATFFPSARTLSAANVIHAIAGREQSAIDLVVPLTKTYQVSGTLTASDAPPSFHAVHLMLADLADNPLFDVSTAVTDGAGAFTSYGVPPGQYLARVVRTPYPAGDARLVAGGAGNGQPMSVFISGGSPASGPPRLSDEPLAYADQPITVIDRNVKDVNIALRQGVHVRGHAEFLGASTPPTPAQMRQTFVTLEPANGQAYGAIMPNALSDDGHFVTPSSWPSRYLLRVTGTPPGWTFKGAMYQGRDVSESPLALSSDIDDIALTFTDHPSKIDGTVVGDDGKPDLGAVVLLFPVDAASWVDYGRTSRRVRSVPTTAGAFTLTNVPEGDYLLIAISDADATDWQNPAILQKLSSLAEHVHVADGQASSISLRTKRLP